MQVVLPTWRFFRAGGFDQVRLDTAAELLSIAKLDQKLWVALSCPVKGIEFDARTLALIDSDADGQVRAPELIAAVRWVDERLKNKDVLTQKMPGVPLLAIREDDETGQRICAAAREVLAETGASDGMVTVEAASAAQARYAEKALAAWEAQGVQARPLGDATEAAYAALMAVADKVDDWFVRCNLAAFDGRAGDALNASAEAFTALGAASLKSTTEGIAALPLAHVQAQASLPLMAGTNPAWAEAMVTLRTRVVLPFLGARDALTAQEWQSLKDQLAPFATWQAGKPDPATQGEGVRELEQLARYVRDLLVLANNFVAFLDICARRGFATFQVGTLYLDGRSCELCVAVNDAAKHGVLANLARICLVYVDCVRGAEKMSVAAAFTAGDSDQLMVGRNGVFYDRQGRDWNATITKIVEHPISLRQAFWSPYKRLARMVSDLAQKAASSKSKEADDRMALAATQGAKAATPTATPTPPQAAPAPATAFDVGKFAGIFAAIGLALGALGTALASVMVGLFALSWWQFPLVLAGLMLLISGPAVVMAWFKLRSRNLGPILDANGWAINARARINIPFGTSLTQVAQLPEGAERSLADPYAEEQTPWGIYGVVLAVVVLALVVWQQGWLPKI